VSTRGEIGGRKVPRWANVWRGASEICRWARCAQTHVGIEGTRSFDNRPFYHHSNKWPCTAGAPGPRRGAGAPGVTGLPAGSARNALVYQQGKRGAKPPSFGACKIWASR